MRLTISEQQAICLCAKSIFPKSGFNLYLYGSRVDDSKNGGDIDLLLVVEQDLTKKQCFDGKLDLLVALKKEIGDQKIDLTVTTQARAKCDPFIQHIMPSAVILCSLSS